MYTRSKEMGIPPNYGGCAFGRSETKSRRQLDLKPPEALSCPLSSSDSDASTLEGANQALRKETRKEQKKEPRKEISDLLSPLGSLGTEELLLIAIAIVVFQSGKQPDLALILLALLFIN